MLKRIVTNIIIAVLLCCFISVYADDSAIEFFDFESFELGTKPSGDLLEFNNPVSNETVNNIENNFIGKGTADENNVFNIKKMPQKVMVVSIDLKEIPDHASSYVPQLQFLANNGAKTAAITPNFYGGTLNNDVTENEWSTITIRYNFREKTNSIYFNGELKDTDRKNVRKINDFNADGAFDGEESFLQMNFMGFYIDNVKVSIDDEKFELQDIRFNGVKLTDYNNVPLSLSDISLVFDAPVNTETLTDAVTVTAANETVEWTEQYDADSKTYHILLNGLTAGTEYTVSIADTLQNTTGIAFTAKNIVFTSAESNYIYSNHTLANDSCSVKIKNATFVPQSFTLVVFVYNSKGMLVDCAQSDAVEIGVLGESTLTPNTAFSYSSEYTTVMTVWDTPENALPLMDIYQ